MNSKKKWIFGLLGTVALGAIGSGVWDVALKPSAEWLGRRILTAATLGMTSFKSAMYEEAARGYHEAAALQTFLIVSTFFVGVPVGLMATRYFWRAVDRGLDKQPQRGRDVVRNRIFYAAQAFAVLLGSIVVIRSLWAAQVNRTATFFNQSAIICRPYLSDAEYQQLCARFAAMHNKEDFLNIIEQLHSVARQHKATLPEFDPW